MSDFTAVFFTAVDFSSVPNKEQETRAKVMFLPCAVAGRKWGGGNLVGLVRSSETECWLINIALVSVEDLKLPV